MADVAHPILPSLQNIKLAMDSILKTAQDVIDVGRFLDAQGRLPFTSILPLLQELPKSGGMNMRQVCDIIGGNEGMGDAYPLLSDEITEIADHARIILGGRDEIVLSIPNCKRIGIEGFFNASITCNTNTFKSLEEVGERAFYNCIFYSYATFPKLTSIGPKAFYSTNGDITLPSVQTIPGDAFTARTEDGAVDYSIYGIRTLRLPNLTKETVLTMPGYPFGMIQYRWRSGSGYPGGKEIWKTTEREIICANREIIVPEQTETLKRYWE